MIDEHIEQLVHRYLDGEATDAEVAELRRAIEADPGNLKVLFRRAEMQADLTTILREDAQAARGPVEVKAPVLWWRPVLALAASLVVVAGVTTIYLQRPGSSPSVAIASIRTSTEQATISRGSQLLAAPAGMKIFGGDRLTVSEEGYVIVDYLGEATVIDAEGPLAMTMRAERKGKRVNLDYGRVTCHVAPQPKGRPMVVLTPHAEATVVGTRFTLDVSQGSSQVYVDEGEVLFKRVENPSVVHVSAGLSATIADGIPLAAVPVVKGRLYEMTREEVDAFFGKITMPAQVEYFSRVYLYMNLLHTQPNAYGERPLLLKREGADPGSLKNYDLSRINPAYFSHLNYILDKATAAGVPISFVLDPGLVELVESASSGTVRSFAAGIKPYCEGKKILLIMGNVLNRDKVQLLLKEMRGPSARE